jgi:hypothetical protein
MLLPPGAQDLGEAGSGLFTQAQHLEHFLKVGITWVADSAFVESVERDPETSGVSEDYASGRLTTVTP